MHNHDNKYPARPGFEPGTSRLQAPVDTNDPSGLNRSECYSAIQPVTNRVYSKPDHVWSKKTQKNSFIVHQFKTRQTHFLLFSRLNDCRIKYCKINFLLATPQMHSTTTCLMRLVLEPRGTLCWHYRWITCICTDVWGLFYKPFNCQIIKFEFSPTWSCVSLPRSTTTSEWKLFRFDKMKVNYFQLLLIDVKFFYQHVWKLTGNVLIKKCKKRI